MYLPAHFDETRVDVMHALIAAHPLATLVVLADGRLSANHVPMLVAPGGRLGVLRAHVARANPLWREHSPSVDALAVFAGSQSYITPSWYPSKHETGQVVPTWNYAVVHASGPLTIIDDPAWLRPHVEAMTAHNERLRDPPWRVADAPPDFIDAMLRAIVGIEIPVYRLEGKWKVSQNRLPRDRQGVVEGLTEQATDQALAMARLVGGAADQ